MGPSKTSFLSFYNRNIQTKNINGICEQERTNFEENVRKAVFNRQQKSTTEPKRENNSLLPRHP